MSSRVTLKQVALHAGVSYQTVSKVLNNKAQVSKVTEERIWQSIHSLGYRPNLIARSLRSQRSRLIGYSWAPTPRGQANPILDRFLQSMIEAAENAGYHLLTFPYRQGKDWIDLYRELIDTNRVDAFVLSSVDFDDPRILFLQERNFPFVAFGRSNDAWIFPYVDIDGGAGMRMVVEHLVDQGRRRLAILAWPVESRVGQNRLAGLRDSLEGAGIDIPPDRLLRGEGSYQFGRQATQLLMDRLVPEWPDAILGFNDAMAIGAMHAIQEKGLAVGEAIAVTGFDDTPMIQYLTPPLTSVRQPVWEVGQRLMAMLMCILEGAPYGDSQVLLQPRLIVRESSGAVIV